MYVPTIHVAVQKLRDIRPPFPPYIAIKSVKARKCGVYHLMYMGGTVPTLRVDILSALFSVAQMLPSDIHSNMILLQDYAPRRRCSEFYHDFGCYAYKFEIFSRNKQLACNFRWGFDGASLEIALKHR